MYIRKNIRRYRDKTYINHLLVESVHTPKGPRQKTVCSLGNLSPRPAKEWLKLAHKIEDALLGQEGLFYETDAETKEIKAENGNAKTREAKLGCVFTQTKVDEKGRPIRDESSTSYVGAIETAKDFGKRIYAEAKRRAMDRPGELAVLGDGAQWIWNIADESFPGATHIIDLYHAREHYWEVGKVVLEHNKEALNKWAEKRRRELDDGDVEKVIKAIKLLSPSTGKGKELCEKAVNYFEKNKERMRYNLFRKRGFFVGSGVLEAGCKTVIGQRLKQSGMHWTSTVLITLSPSVAASSVTVGKISGSIVSPLEMLPINLSHTRTRAYRVIQSPQYPI